MKVVKSAPHYTETALDEIKLLKCVSITFVLHERIRSHLFIQSFTRFPRLVYVPDKKKKITLIFGKLHDSGLNTKTAKVSLEFSSTVFFFSFFFFFFLLLEKKSHIIKAIAFP